MLKRLREEVRLICDGAYDPISIIIPALVTLVLTMSLAVFGAFLMAYAYTLFGSNGVNNFSPYIFLYFFPFSLAISTFLTVFVFTTAYIGMKSGVQTKTYRIKK